MGYGFLSTLCAIGLVLSAPVQAQPAAAGIDEPALRTVTEAARQLGPLRTMIVARDGKVLAEEGFHGARTNRSTNIKSASKSVVSALVGIAIDKGVLEGVDQTIAPILANKLPPNPDPQMRDITIGHLLSMQAGLDRTSGPNYGAWISSPDWVRAALARPFVADPGGEMLYSTGSTHLLSAILTRVTGKSTFALAREWLEPAGVSVSSWERDPQGIYLGGNQMAMTPKSLFRFGELYRNGGRTPEGTQVVPEAWVRESWAKRTTTRWSGDDYGYGWFGIRLANRAVHYGWGYGGQMIYVVPDLGLTIAMTSDENAPSARTGYKEALHGLVAGIIAAAEAAPQPPSPAQPAG